mmetsp:Transcript_130681/g.310016  ORF Transcript_130681/g.310016 Transcript_130681/m.310016 type:complete len:248 (+) Transcript_130681:250-993(+)
MPDLALGRLQEIQLARRSPVVGFLIDVSHSCTPALATLFAAAGPLVPIAHVAVGVRRPSAGPRLLQSSLATCASFFRILRDAPSPHGLVLLVFALCPGAPCSKFAVLALGLAVLWNFEARGLRQGAITGRAAVVVLHLHLAVPQLEPGAAALELPGAPGPQDAVPSHARPALLQFWAVVPLLLVPVTDVLQGHVVVPNGPQVMDRCQLTSAHCQKVQEHQPSWHSCWRCHPSPVFCEKRGAAHETNR